MAHIEAGIDEFANEPTAGLACHRLMTLAHKHETKLVLEYAVLAEKLAGRFLAANDHRFAEIYWRQAADWHHVGRNESEVARCRIAAAECLIAGAETMAAGPKSNSAMAAHWMGRGVEALRQARGDKSRVITVHRRFLELQKQARLEMTPVKIDLDDIPGLRANEEKEQEQAAASVRGLPFEEAVTALVFVTLPSEVTKMKATFEQQNKGMLWDKLFASSKVDRAGKVTDLIPAAATGDREEEDLRKLLYEQCRAIYWPFRVTGRIDPARRAIRNEHAVRLGDLFFLIDSNPMIPTEHAPLIVRGLQAGFVGDWVVAMHLLIPQMEAVIRHVLDQNAVVTSTLSSDSTQEDFQINKLLWMPETEEVFGVDIMFDLRGLMVERFGHNFRNESAHGLMPANAFYQPACAYLWWLILLICWHGHYIGRQREMDGAS